MADVSTGSSGLRPIRVSAEYRDLDFSKLNVNSPNFLGFLDHLNLRPRQRFHAGWKELGMIPGY
jgi:hypothetical protein